MNQDEAIGPGRKPGCRVVKEPRRSERAELRQHGDTDRRSYAMEDPGGERHVLVDHLGLLDERIRRREVDLDRVGSALGRPRGAACEVGDERLGVPVRGRRADDADDQNLARPDALPCPANVLAPHVWLHRGLAQRDGNGGVTVPGRPSRDDRCLLPIFHVTDVGEGVGRPEGRPNRRIGKDIEAQPGIALYPLRVQEGARGDAQARVEHVAEESAAGSRGKAPHAR